MMLTADGPKVLEFNCRFGDPETQVLVPRMPFRVGTLLLACATGRLAFEAGHAGFDEGAAVTVVLASEGYPGSYPTGLPISGVDAAESIDGVTVFHAGTARDAEGRLVTAGGRVLSVTGTGASLADARDRAYAACRTRSIRRDAVPDGHRRQGGRGGADERRRSPLVGVLAASPSELPMMQQAGLILEKFDIPHEVRSMSSSRNPDLVDEYARTAFERGLKALDLLDRDRRATSRRRSPRGRCCRSSASRSRRHRRWSATRRLAITAQMPTRHPDRDGRGRRRGERRDPRDPDPRGGRRRGAGQALEVQGRPGGGPEAVIDRYARARGLGGLVRRGPDAELARDRARRGRGLGGPRRGAEGRRACVPRSRLVRR